MPPLMSLYPATSIAEVLLHVAALPLIALNLYAIGTTSVIHFNLKLLLQCQSIGILLVSLIRPVEILWPDWNGMIEVGGRMLYLMVFLRIVGIVLNGLVGYVMPIERCYATIKVRSYEWDKGKCFSVTSMAIMVGME